jgi:hypothetical protein
VNTYLFNNNREIPYLGRLYNKGKYKMIEKEYLTTKEIAISTNQTTRNVRYIINKLDVPKSMLYKDNNDTYMIHHLLLPYFAPKVTGTLKEYAVSFDILNTSSDDDIKKIMEYMGELLPKLKMQYSIEAKQNEMKHIHSIVSGVSKTELKEKIRLCFHENTRVYTMGIYDKQGWQKYISKESPIITLKQKSI